MSTVIISKTQVSLLSTLWIILHFSDSFVFLQDSLDISERLNHVSEKEEMSFNRKRVRKSII
jgi:hypothetical protein